MANSNRWKCFLLMFIFVTVSSALPQRSADNSTNEVSAKKCPFDEFECQDGRGNCIRRSWRCDGEEDCIDGSDEKDCYNNRQSGPECKFGAFMCQDGSDRCIEKSWRCDGEDDCSDGSDEKNCYSNKMMYTRCPPGMFMCLDGSERCIRGSWRCNGEYDCKDGSDEKNCFTTSIECPHGEFMCNDGSRRCIRDSWRCDGEDDCSNGSDEKNCYITDSAQQSLNISNEKSEIYEDQSQIYKDLKNLVERVSDQQEADKARNLLGCTLAIRTKKRQCMGRCRTLGCRIQELNNFFTACMTGTEQSCSIQSYTNCNQCGMANTTIDPDITVAANEVNPRRRYPWNVGLFNTNTNNNDRFICGGSIINSRWILTAAQCIINSAGANTDCSNRTTTTGLQVRVGEHQQGVTTDDDPDNTRAYIVKRTVIHPDHNCPGLNNELALLELEEEIPFNKVIRPVCLPTDDNNTYANFNAILTGWGSTQTTPAPPDFLMEAVLPIMPQTDCNSAVAVTDNQMCTGIRSTGGVCNGDLGGPLAVRGDNNIIQVGVVSAFLPCTPTPTTTDTYVRVSKFLNWIRDTTTTGKCS